MNDFYVRDDAALSTLVDRARSTGRAALDLEFHRERRYWAQLALVQLRVEDSCVLVDPLDGPDLTPIDELVSDPDVIKVLHAPSQDLEIFLRRSGREARNVFDTQTAAALLGLGAQISLGQLIHEVLGIHLPKGEGFTNWLRRPLTDAQERYALGDVAHLFELHDAMMSRLREGGRESWLEEELARFEHAETFLPPPRTAYLRLRRAQRLSGPARAVARELAAWREEEARRRDRPRRTIVSDEVILELSRTAPDTELAVRDTRGLDPREAGRSAPAILEAVARGRELPEEERPAGPRPAVSRAQSRTTSLLSSVLTAMASEAQIDASMLATDEHLESLVMAHLSGDSAAIPLLEGWRAELAGQRLLRFLDGQITLRLAPEDHRPVFEDLGTAAGSPPE